MAVDSGSVTSLDERRFFESYIARRKPFKFTSWLADPELKASRELWTDDYLIAKAGDAKLQVEKRLSPRDRFGRGKEHEVTLREFLLAKDENCYLTTQELVHDEEGRPAIISPPLDKLQGDFPWRPRLMGHLIPQNINLWMGYTKEYSSSGLHHDYHDNLYLLLQGSKHFDLYPVEEIDNMYTYGEVLKVHVNGRVNYVGQPTNADGSDVQAIHALESSLALEKALNRLEANEDDEEAEEEVERALERALDAEMSGEVVGSDEEDSSSEEEPFALEPSIEEAIAKSLPTSKHPLSEKGRTAVSPPDSKRRRKSTTDAEPMSFSRVDTSLSEEELKKLFPRFLDARKRRLEVDLQAGEMLYIPAGWFHEVRSRADGTDGAHIALNYWFHPPDSMDFDKPYATDFWPRDWEDRVLRN